MNRYIASFIAILVISTTAYTPTSYASNAPESFADTVEELMPMVVNISTRQTIKTQTIPGMPFSLEIPGLPEGHPLEQFRQFFEQIQPEAGGIETERQAQSLGSGFILSGDGYIVTNNHVIEAADEITAILSNGDEYAARIIGRDLKTDLALLKIDPKESLPAVKFGNSDDARVGDWIIAIGNPYGLGGSVSAGIISARARDIHAGPFDDFIQTDAAINRGNSGGPMFNTDGEVIGINTAIFSPSGGNIGIGFAIPSVLAKPIIDQLKKNGKVRRAWLGVKIQTVTDEIAESLSMPSTEGALVVDISQGSPAAEYGIKTGDIILEFDSRPIKEMRKLPRIVAETEINKQVKVTVWRQGSEKTLLMKLAELEEDGAEVADNTQEPQPLMGAGKVVLGMEIQPLSKEQRAAAGLTTETGGVLVTGVKNGSPASRRGIRRGDIIIRTNEKPITDGNSFSKEIKRLAGTGKKFVLLRVVRSGETVFVTVDISEKE